MMDGPKTGPHFSVPYTYGDHRYRRPGEDPTVYFRNPQLGVERVIVDGRGRIRGFPGVDRQIKQLLGKRPAPVVRFRSELGALPDGRLKMDWQIQPDGRYWGDDGGFGMEDDVELVARAFVDARGRFTGPFRLLKYGIHEYD